MIWFKTNETSSRNLQKWLLSQGWRWGSSGRKNVQYTTTGYIALDVSARKMWLNAPAKEPNALPPEFNQKGWAFGEKCYFRDREYHLELEL